MMCVVAAMTIASFYRSEHFAYDSGATHSGNGRIERYSPLG